MRKVKFFAASAVFMLVVTSYGKTQGSEDRLSGTWESDVERTVEFNKKFVQEQLYIDLLRCFSANISLRFIDGKLIKEIPDHQCASGGKSGEISGSKIVFDYEIIFENENLVVVRLQNQSGADTARVFRFEGDSSFWFVEEGDDLFFREFYRKVAN